MKKLMILAAAIVCGVAAQAATVSWGSSGIYVPLAGTKEGEYLKANSSTRIVTASLWEFAAYDGFKAYEGKTSAELYALKGDLGKATATGSSGSTGSLSMGGTTNYGENDKAYGVIIYEFTSGNDTWYAAYAKASSEAVGTGISIGGILSSSKTDVSAWTKVGSGPTPTPEPTSGLLLLLGMAGLALRRRRA